MITALLTLTLTDCVIIGKAKINRISMYRIQTLQTPICYNVQHIAAMKLFMYRLCTMGHLTYETFSQVLALIYAICLL